MYLTCALSHLYRIYYINGKEGIRFRDENRSSHIKERSLSKSVPEMRYVIMSVILVVLYIPKRLCVWERKKQGGVTQGLAVGRSATTVKL